MENVPARGVRVWTANLAALEPDQIAGLAAHLDETERARTARFCFARDQNNFTAARGLLRSLLGELSQRDPGALRFDYGERGKPSLSNRAEGEKPIHFNLSHSSGWAMIAVASGRAVGIDLENTGRLDRKEADLDRLAERVLSPQELTLWRTLPLERKSEAFLRAWTRKEAYGKATGRGVFESLSEIEVVLDLAAPRPSLNLEIRNRAIGLTSHWSLHDLEAPPGFAAALAVARAEDLTSGGAVVVAPGSNASHGPRDAFPG